MTCIIAARADSGHVVVGSDSLVTVGDRKLYLERVKGFFWAGLDIYHAGPLDFVQRFQTLEGTVKCPCDLGEVQRCIWEHPPPRKERDQVEWLVVDKFSEIHTVSGHGDAVTHSDYAVAGSEFGWVGMDLLYPKIRNKTEYNVRKCIGRVIQAVAKRDTSVGGAVRFQEL